MHLEAKGDSDVHLADTSPLGNEITADCEFSIGLPTLPRSRGTLACRNGQAEGMGAATRNTYRGAAVAFCNWCIETGRLIVNPLPRIAKADEDADRRRQRRALTEDELRRLLDVARRRPLVDAMTIRRGKRKGEGAAVLREEPAAGWKGSAGNGS